MTVLHREKRLVYLAHPRTASVATEQALYRRAGFQVHERGIRHERREDLPVDDGWTAFTTVRNHWDACVSWWTARNRTGSMTPEYIHRMHEEHGPYVGEEELWGLHRHDADVVLRYETLEPQLNALLTGHGLGPIRLTRRNVTRGREGRHYSEFYDEETREAVREKWRAEIEELGYAYEREPVTVREG